MDNQEQGTPTVASILLRRVIVKNGQTGNEFWMAVYSYEPGKPGISFADAIESLGKLLGDGDERWDDGYMLSRVVPSDEVSRWFIRNGTLIDHPATVAVLHPKYLHDEQADGSMQSTWCPTVTGVN